MWAGDDVVIVHDWFGGMGGAEAVLRELASLFPSAPILTLFADRRSLVSLGIDPARVRESYLGRIPHALRFRRFLLPWFADAVQTLDVGDARLIISSSHAVAKGVPHKSYQAHLAYTHSPMRYAHDLMPNYVRSAPRILRPWLRSVLRRLAVWDVMTAQGVGRFVANSRAVAQRILRTYRRRALVIHPPVDVTRIPFTSRERDDYYVALSRLVAYKRLDIAVAAAASLGRRLVVVGEGPERTRLEALARRLGAAKTTNFLGQVSDGQKWELLGRARALLFPGEEDFGIVGVESLATGTPVVALGRGGMLDVLGSTCGPLLGGPPRQEPGGVVFAEQSPSSLANAIRTLEESGSPDFAAHQSLAERFAVARFRKRMLVVARRLLDST